jgi:hypothetical protein
MKDDELADFVNAISSDNESDDETFFRNDTNNICSNVPDSNSDGSDILVEETDHMLVTLNKKLKMMQILMQMITETVMEMIMIKCQSNDQVPVYQQDLIDNGYCSPTVSSIS